MVSQQSARFKNALTQGSREKEARSQARDGPELGGVSRKEWTVIGLEGVKPIPGMNVVVPREGLKELS
jgi:hypothetical protein